MVGRVVVTGMVKFQARYDGDMGFKRERGGGEKPDNMRL